MIRRWARVGPMRMYWKCPNENIKILTDISFMPDFEMAIRPDPNGLLFKSLVDAGWTPPKEEQRDFE